jgi:hypothetical protein
LKQNLVVVRYWSI